MKALDSNIQTFLQQNIAVGAHEPHSDANKYMCIQTNSRTSQDATNSGLRRSLFLLHKVISVQPTRSVVPVEQKHGSEASLKQSG